MKPGTTEKKGPRSWDDITKAMTLLAGTEVLVGFPQDKDQPRDDGSITNAALGYIHDQGMPEQNIPQREFMRPGVESIQDEIERRLVNMAKKAAKGDVAAMETGFISLGLRGKLAIQNKISEGIPPPLADSTLRARARRGSKGAQLELDSRAEGNLPTSSGDARTLVDTSQMRSAVNFAVRLKKERQQ